jgi:hypothetical protein
MSVQKYSVAGSLIERRQHALQHQFNYSVLKDAISVYAELNKNMSTET